MMNDLLTIAIITASVITTSFLIMSLKTSNHSFGKLLLQPIQTAAGKTKVLHILFKMNLRNGKTTFKNQNHRR
ncbi:MAG: hypothetical protein ACN6N7_09215 [Chryseobacterium culicis]